MGPGIADPQGPPNVWEGKIRRENSRGICQQAALTLRGKGVIQEKDETVYVAPGQGNACQDSRVFNALKQKICSQR